MESTSTRTTEPGAPTRRVRSAKASRAVMAGLNTSSAVPALSVPKARTSGAAAGSVLGSAAAGSGASARAARRRGRRMGRAPWLGGSEREEGPAPRGTPARDPAGRLGGSRGP